MTQAITAASTWAEITAAPQDGEEASIDAGAAPLKANVLQILANRDAHLARYLPEPPPVVICDTTTIALQAHPGLWIGGKATSTAGVSVSLSGLSAATRYYVYTYLSSGAVALDVSTTATDTHGVWKSDGLGGSLTTHRWVATFVAKAATKALPFVQVGRKCTYSLGQGTDYTRDDFAALASGASTSLALVDLSAFVPPIALCRTVHLIGLFKPRTTNLDTFTVRCRTGSNIGFAFDAQGVATGDLRAFNVSLNPRNDADRAVEYSVSHLDCRLSLFVNGWEG